MDFLAADDPSVLPAWIAAIAAGTAVLISLLALLRSWNAQRHANRSATAAEKSEFHAKRSADSSAESAVHAGRSADAAEEQVELAKETSVRWKPVRDPEGRHRVAFVNIGSEDAHDVEVVGDAIRNGPVREVLRRPGEELLIMYKRRTGSERVTIIWHRPPGKGGERKEQTYDLWPPNEPDRPKVFVA